MRRVIRTLAALAVVASVSTPWTASARPIKEPSTFTGEGDRPAAAASNPASRIDQRLRSKTGSVNVIVELADPAASSVYSAARNRGASTTATTSAVQQQITRIDQTQRQVLNAISSTKATVLYRTQRVFNGIALHVDASKLAQIAAQANVKAIYPLIPKRLDNSSSVPLIGAPTLWDSAGLNATGEGIKIGIIDTGIDYLHTGFGGSGLKADYDANDTTVITDGFFPTAKVVGGYDFAGDDYNADPNSASYQPVPHPDPDPMDCNGHGSHVAGTSAGYGVNSDGSTYTGAYGPGIDFNGFRIGPGVAPKASLYALRVFGCDGSTNVVMEALEWAVDPNGDANFADHLDVVNMSLGSDFGSGVDVDSIAANNAVEAGVIVVASAGNAGDVYSVSGSPGNAEQVISVASSVDSTDVTDAFSVEAPGDIADLYPASRSANFNWLNPPAAHPLPVTADLYYPATNQSGCVAWTGADLTNIAGKIVLVDWRAPGQANFPCGSTTRTNNATNAGAVGIIMVDNTPYFETAISGNGTIPAMYTVSTVGDTLKSKLTAGTPSSVSVKLSAEYINAGKLFTPERTDTLSEFSSRGPGRGTNLKPDIAAPGQGIFSVGALTGNQGESINGTSMAAPHIAGSMALLKQLHPTWTVQQLKALAMNTANKSVRSAIDAASPIYGPSRVGAGRVNLVNAAAQSVIAYNTANPSAVSVSFGTVEVTNTLTLSKQVTVENKGAAAATFDVAYTATSEIPGVAYSVSPAQVSLEAGETKTVTITLTATASQMKHTHDPTIAEEQVGEARHWISEAQGYLTLATSGAPTPELRVPVYAAARPVATMHAASSTLQGSQITLAGNGINTGDNTPVDIKSLVSAFELQDVSPKIAETGTYSASADLQYVGVTSTVTSTSTITDGVVYFGLSTYQNWETLSQLEFDIYIDVDRDGTEDYVLYTTTIPSGSDPTNVFVTRLVDLKSSTGSYQDYVNFVPASAFDTEPFNTNVVALGVYAADLGLSAENSSFNYQVYTFALEQGPSIDTSEVHTYDVTKPSVTIGAGIAGLPVFLDQAGTTIPVGYNPNIAFSSSPKGVLLLHHHNIDGQRAEVVGASGQIALPLIYR